MVITKFVLENARADYIMMFDFADCAANSLGRPWRVPVPGRNELDTELLAYTRCMLYD
jgi:hypothetical protein